MNYPLKKNKFDPNVLYPSRSYYSDEYAQSHCALYLSDEFVHDSQGNTHKCFRLHASEPHTIDMALGYEIQCPDCGRRKLRLVGRSLNMHDLGLYYCPACDSAKKKW